jgi:hypothetical protein
MRRGRAGQALVEVALITPTLMALVGGAGQVGAVAYGNVTVDTAAREGARVATDYPNRALDFVKTLGASTYTCGQTPSDSSTETSVCDAVRSASGLLPASQMAISLAANHAVSRLPADVVRVGNPCPGAAPASGIVGNLPAGSVATMSSPSAASSGMVTSDSAGNYSICLAIPSSSTLTTTITATTVNAAGCTYHTSISVTVSTTKTVTPTPANMTLPSSGTCPGTPTPTPVATPGPTPTAWALGPVPTPAPSLPCSTVVPDTSYVAVTVSYRVPIFVPFVNRILADTPSASVRTVSATEVMQIEPCTITQGG